MYTKEIERVNFAPVAFDLMAYIHVIFSLLQVVRYQTSVSANGEV